MNRIGVFSTLVISALAVNGCKGASSLSAGSGNSDRLVLNPELNHPYTFVMSMKSSGMTNLSVSMTMSETFDSKTADGYHANLKILDVTGGGAAMAQAISNLKGTEYGMTISPQGKVLSTDKSTGNPFGIGPGGGLSSIEFPTGSLHVGQSWSNTIDSSSNPALKNMPGIANLTVNNKVSKMGAGIITIESTMNEPASSGTAMSTDSSTDFSTSDGLPVKSTVTTKMSVGSMSMNTDLTIQRQ